LAGEKWPAVASSTNPATMMANSAAKANPILFHGRCLPRSAAARSGRRRCLASGSRGAPSATASTRSALAASGGSRPGDTGSRVIASPQTMRRAWTSLRRTTYSVRPAILIWLGAGLASAAATKDGADIDEPDRTAQSRKNVRIRSPRLVLKMATPGAGPG